MPWKRAQGAAALVAATLMLGGCGGGSGGNSAASDSLPPTQTGTFRLVFEGNDPPAGADAVHLVFFDRLGRQVHGPLEVPLGPLVEVPGVPMTAARVEADYLQNGGLALFESWSGLAWAPAQARSQRGVRARSDDFVAVASDPAVAAAPPARSVWSAGVSGGQAQITVATQGKPGLDQALSTPAPFQVKGVAYSPTSIGIDVKKSGHLGDYFWDGWMIQGAGQLLDWERVWERDLEEIRDRFNSVRLYTMLAVHLQDDGTFPDWSNPTVRQHQKFLDALWNNNDRPLYALVGIPINNTLFDGTATPDAERFWRENLQRTVDQVKGHPAVMGFTIFNEVGGHAEWGADPAKSELYWQRIQEFSRIVEEAAPGKLVGFAWFDAPSDVAQASNAGLPQKYGGHLDFWGVNAFQATTIGPSLAPYKTLGSASKPVIFTEFGQPATSHSDTSLCEAPSKPTQAGVDSIYADGNTVQKAADAIAHIVPITLADPIVGGLFYFEWNDEWWKQDPNAPCYTTRADRQEGGTVSAVSQMPNGFNDEEGYGLHAIALNGRAADQLFSPFDPNAAAANVQPDTLTPRQGLLDALKAALGTLR